MEFLISRPDEAEKMGERGRNAVHEYDNWQRKNKNCLSFTPDCKIC